MPIVPDAPDRGYFPLAATMGKIGGNSAMNRGALKDLVGIRILFKTTSIIREYCPRTRDWELNINKGGLNLVSWGVEAISLSFS
jgi:hypothetical protein